jgi:hypothetical protein
MYTAGGLSQVAGATGNQQASFGAGAQGIATSGGQGLDALAAQQSRLSSMAMAPSQDVINAQKQSILLNAQRNVAGLDTQFGGTGTLGSARQAVMQGSQNADTTAKLAQVDADYENKMFTDKLQAESQLGQSIAGSSALANQTASGLANLGNQERTVDQSTLDAGWQGLQRYASTVYGNPARQSATSNAGGK